MKTDLKRYIQSHIEFGALWREQLIPLHSTDWRDLRDLKLIFHTQGSLNPLIASHGLMGPEDIRFYINGADVSGHVIIELREALRTAETSDPNAFRSQYEEAARSYIRFHGKLGEASSVAKNVEFLEQFLQRPTLYDSMIALGDRTFGWSGNMHLINFIYRSIELNPISLQAVFDRYRRELGQPAMQLSELKKFDLVISQGPAPSYEDFDPTAVLPKGTLTYNLEVIHKNPLADEIRKINERLKDISMRLNLQRVRYLEPIKSEIELSRSDLQNSLPAVSSAIDRLKASFEEIIPE